MSKNLSNKVFGSFSDMGLSLGVKPKEVSKPTKEKSTGVKTKRNNKDSRKESQHRRKPDVNHDAAYNKPNSFGEDGVDHINVNAQAETNLGRFLDPGKGARFEYPFIGEFRSILAMTSWLKDPAHNESLRFADNTALQTLLPEVHRKKKLPSSEAITIVATLIKLSQRPDLIDKIKKLPKGVKVLSYKTIPESGIRVATVFAKSVSRCIQEVVDAIQENREPKYDNFKHPKATIQGAFLEPIITFKPVDIPQPKEVVQKKKKRKNRVEKVDAYRIEPDALVPDNLGVDVDLGPEIEDPELSVEDKAVVEGFSDHLDKQRQEMKDFQRECNEVVSLMDNSDITPISYIVPMKPEGITRLRFNSAWHLISAFSALYSARATGLEDEIKRVGEIFEFVLTTDYKSLQREKTVMDNNPAIEQARKDHFAEFIYEQAVFVEVVRGMLTKGMDGVIELFELVANGKEAEFRDLLVKCYDMQSKHKDKQPAFLLQSDGEALLAKYGITPPTPISEEVKLEAATTVHKQQVVVDVYKEGGDTHVTYTDLKEMCSLPNFVKSALAQTNLPITEVKISVYTGATGFNDEFLISLVLGDEVVTDAFCSINLFDTAKLVVDTLKTNCESLPVVNVNKTSLGRPLYDFILHEYTKLGFVERVGMYEFTRAGEAEEEIVDETSEAEDAESSYLSVDDMVQDVENLIEHNDVNIETIDLSFYNAETGEDLICVTLYDEQDPWIEIECEHKSQDNTIEAFVKMLKETLPNVKTVKTTTGTGTVSEFLVNQIVTVVSASQERTIEIIPQEKTLTVQCHRALGDYERYQKTGEKPEGLMPEQEKIYPLTYQQAKEREKALANGTADFNDKLVFDPEGIDYCQDLLNHGVMESTD